MMMKPMIMMMMTLTMMITLTTKSTGMMCIMLCLYSILSSILMALTLKLNLMTFIMIMTMVGGLMVLFLYFTASNFTPNKVKQSKYMTNMKMFTIMMIVMTMLGPKPETMKTPDNLIDPSQQMFYSSSFTPNMLLLVTLLIMLVSVISLCSKSQKPMRRTMK